MIATEVKERPILFSAPMVQAILEDRKTQTRRVVKLPPFDPSDDSLQAHALTNLDKCKYGKPGDRLWVKETFWIELDSDWSEVEQKTYYHSVDLSSSNWADVRYVASEPNFSGHDGISTAYEKRPSIFMPRWASRITLEVTDVRVERLQSITNSDAAAEGVIQVGYQYQPKDAFLGLWQSINGKTYPWDSNPWVWVVSFKRIQP
ncbi:hypothetical protein [Pantanalinema sp. GBBB05]|uniref:hypothetical protein n=1 Tax=Pantanalinema sp. GBBB05 TaxID=2604139 RepID=UPI001D2CDD34|nr:hypothetical protein [Pantanalinema sp. GBBB05]